MATTISPQSTRLEKKLEIVWETLPPDFVLLDDPVNKRMSEKVAWRL